MTDEERKAVKKAFLGMFESVGKYRTKGTEEVRTGKEILEEAWAKATRGEGSAYIREQAAIVERVQRRDGRWVEYGLAF